MRLFSPSRRSFHMDFNTFFIRFGLDSSNFVNKPPEIINTPDGYIYEVYEDYKQRICPYCNHQFLQIHDYKWIKINLSSTKGIRESLRIKRIRYKCSSCHTPLNYKGLKEIKQ